MSSRPTCRTEEGTWARPPDHGAPTAREHSPLGPAAAAEALVTPSLKDDQYQK